MPFAVIDAAFKDRASPVKVFSFCPLFAVGWPRNSGSLIVVIGGGLMVVMGCGLMVVIGCGLMVGIGCGLMVVMGVLVMVMGCGSIGAICR